MSLDLNACFEEILLNLFGSLASVQAYLKSSLSCIYSLQCIMLELSRDNVTNSCQPLQSDCIHIAWYSLQVKVKKLGCPGCVGWSIKSCKFLHLRTQRLLLCCVRQIGERGRSSLQVRLRRGKILCRLSLLRTILSIRELCVWFWHVWLVSMTVKSRSQEILLLGFLVVDCSIARIRWLLIHLCLLAAFIVLLRYLLPLFSFGIKLLFAKRLVWRIVCLLKNLWA